MDKNNQICQGPHLNSMIKSCYCSGLINLICVYKCYSYKCEVDSFFFFFFHEYSNWVWIEATHPISVEEMMCVSKHCRRPCLFSHIKTFPFLFKWNKVNVFTFQPNLRYESKLNCKSYNYLRVIVLNDITIRNIIKY